MCAVTDAMEAKCMNGGTCTNHLEGYKCTCPEHFTGKNCEIRPSRSTICKDKCRATYPGVCYENYENSTVFCACQAGFTSGMAAFTYMQ